MIHRIVAPPLNPNDIDCTLVRWHVGAWQPVTVGQLIGEVETTKTDFELEAETAGYFYPIVRVGEVVRTGETLGYVFPTNDPAQLDGELLPKTGAADGPLISHKARAVMEEHDLTVADFPGRRVIESEDVLAVAKAKVGAQKDARIESLRCDRTSVAIYGTGSMGTIVFDGLLAAKSHTPVAFVDFAPRAAEMHGLPVIHRHHLGRLREQGLRHLFIALPAGQQEARAEEEANQAGLELINLVHPTAVVSPLARLGRNVYIGPLAIVGPLTELGDFCRVLNAASIAHHSRLGRGVRVADGARVAGHVTIGDYSLLGLGVTVNLRLSIGKHVVVVSGAHIYESTPDYFVVRTDGKAHPRPHS